ncbi:MAG: transketolase [Hyphomicrobiaceae bacterium]|nr:transketolase [Hyphomicrobiaceae bacterium]
MADYAAMANAIRALAMDAVEAAKSGHPGMPMGMADVATVLFAEALTFDPTNPDWPDRDRFVLSAGHGSMLLYALLHLTGYPGMDIDQLKRFRQLGSMTAGHPEYGHAAGIETTTGPLGQGLANAVGMAIAERLLAARAGDDLVDHRTYVIAGDGCLMEGISQEAISLAGHLKLGRLIVLFDDNGITIDGKTDLSTSEDQLARFKASGWNTLAIDGHDTAAISAALATAKADASKPWLIACKTVIGYGAPTKAGTSGIHGSALGAAEIEGARAKLGWSHAPFEIPAEIKRAWEATATRGKTARTAWEARFAKAPAAAKAALGAIDADEMTVAIAAAKAQFLADPAKRATRAWSQLTLEHLIPAVPQMIGGSADLTGSNGTKTKHHAAITAANFAANYMNYGIREHGMAAAMNGMALHGGVVPYGGTFLVFSDYCRPAIRLSALMGVGVVYVMTHDSIGVGEDGPTHQPVEHLASLRSIPNVLVLRPADAIETAEAWEIALTHRDRPSVLALTRDAVATVRTAANATENLSARGAYIAREPKAARDVTLIATGSEVGIAIEAAEALAAEGIAAAVVSMPSFELFRDQDESYQTAVIGDGPVIAIEAGVESGWHEWLLPEDRFIGMAGFGASAPAKQLYAHFGITADAVVAAAKEMTGR